MKALWEEEVSWPNNHDTNHNEIMIQTQEKKKKKHQYSENEYTTQSNL